MQGCLANAEDDDQALAPKVSLPVIDARERERKGGGQLQRCKLLCDWFGLKCSTAVLCCTACFAAVIYRLSQRMSATVKCRIGFDFGSKGFGHIYARKL